MKLYRLEWNSGVDHVVYDYGDTPFEVLLRALENRGIAENVSIKEINTKAELLAAAAEISKNAK